MSQTHPPPKRHAAGRWRSSRIPTRSAYFERQIKFDPDIWIVEIEDREGRAFVDEKVV